MDPPREDRGFIEGTCQDSGRKPDPAEVGPGGVFSYSGSGNSRRKDIYVDWLGRTVKTARPGFSVESLADSEEVSTYHATTGRLLSTARTGFPATLYEYNAMSQVTKTVTDVDGSGTIGTSSSDRIGERSDLFEKIGSDYWLTATDRTYPFSGSGTAVTLSVTKKRLTGLGASVSSGAVREEVWSYDAENNLAKRTVTVDVDTKRRTVITESPGLASPKVETYLANLLIETTTPDGLVFKKRYDDLSRLSGDIDPRTGTTSNYSTKYSYHANTAWVKELKDAANKRLCYTG